jgi:hypothetical protein
MKQSHFFLKRHLIQFKNVLMAVGQLFSDVQKIHEFQMKKQLFNCCSVQEIIKK